MRRWLLIGFSGLFLIAVVVVVFNFSRFNDMRRRFSTDYQKLPEVVYYKNNLMRLEKSRRMMYVAGRNSIAALPGAADQFEELEDYNRSVESFTKNAALIKEVEALFRAGEDQQARARLVNTAKEMIAMREEVESRTKSYLDASD